jgi:hypothetical protein
LSGDLFGTIELDVVTPLFGFEVSISAVLDLDHPLESGLNFSGGLAAGMNLGIGADAGYVVRDIEGQTPLTLDINAGPISLTVLTDDEELNGFVGSVGYGKGVSISSQKSVTLSPRAIIDWIFKRK